MSLFTSILKDIADKTIPKTSAVPKCFNKPRMTDTCNDAVLDMLKREPTRGNLDAYYIALLVLRLAEIYDTVRKHLGEIMSPR